jgi:hypothetical protein
MTISFFLWFFILIAALYASVKKTEPETKTTTYRPTRVRPASIRNQIRRIN